jgi:hypothetical protein
MEIMSSANDNLEQQITEARRSIVSDGYSMSIGELVNLYRDKELIVRPEFQRYFRWSALQKSRLVESILLGIPLPSIFVAQIEGGKWELIDGLQRVSTILELQGELQDEHGQAMPQLVLCGTKFLPALENRVWNSKDSATSLSEAQRLDVKRAKLDVKIVKRDSSPEARLDLFQRLNSYGSSLTHQELRSALLFAVSPNTLKWLESLASYSNFVETVAISDRLRDERFDLELVVRFVVLHNWPDGVISLSALRNLPELLDDKMVEFAKSNTDGSPGIEIVFKKTFDFIASGGGENVFRKWDPAKAEFRGSFLSTAFEVFALGIGYCLARDRPLKSDLLAAVKKFWELPKMSGGFATGMATEKRLTEFMPLGRKLVSA